MQRELILMITAATGTLGAGAVQAQNHRIVAMEGAADAPAEAGAPVFLERIEAFGFTGGGELIIRSEATRAEGDALVALAGGEPSFTVRAADLADFAPDPREEERGNVYGLGMFSRSSDASYGGNNAFRSTPQGKLAIVATSWPARGVPADQGIVVRSPGGDLMPVVRAGDVIFQGGSPPSVEVFKYALTDPRCDDRHGVICAALSEVSRFGSAGVETEEKISILRWGWDGAIERVLASGDAIAGIPEGFVVGGFRDVELADDGGIVVVAAYGPEGYEWKFEGVWIQAPGGGFEPMLTGHDVGWSTRDRAVSRSGYAAAWYSGGEDGDEIWLGGPSGQQRVVRHGDDLGGRGAVVGWLWSRLFQGRVLLVNQRGDLVFHAGTTRPDGGIDFAFWFRDRSGVLVRAIGSGDLLDDIPFAQVTASASGSPVALFDMNDQGQVLFKIEYETLFGEGGDAFVLWEPGRRTRVLYSTSSAVGGFAVVSLQPHRVHSQGAPSVFLDEHGHVLTHARLEFEGARSDALVLSGPYPPSPRDPEPVSPLSLAVHRLPSGGISLAWDGAGPAGVSLEVSGDARTWRPLEGGGTSAQGSIVIDDPLSRFGRRAFFRAVGRSGG